MDLLVRQQTLTSLILVLGTSLLPIYMGDSGGAQPSHVILSFFILLSIPYWKSRFHNWAYLFLALTIWVLIRDLITAIISSDPSVLLPFFYWIYNLILVLAIFFSAKKKLFLNALKHGILLAILVALLGLLIFGYSIKIDGEAVRAVGTFNNPNQLGYFSVCASSILFLLREIKSISKKYFYLSLFTTQFLSIASLSKAAIISNLFLISLIFFKEKFSIQVRLASTVVLIAILSYSAGLVKFDYEDLLLTQRLNAVGADDDDSLSARGYFAFLIGGDFEWITGLGGNEVLKIVGHEVHSTIFSIFNVYGIIGLLLILVLFFLWYMVIKKSLGFFSALGVVMPAMLYGITHNGTRFTMFWILFAASISICSSRTHILKIR
jgi:hypothetical protein